MIISEFSDFCDATSLSTSGTGKVQIGGTLDLGKTDPGDIGVMARPLYAVFVVTTGITVAASTGTLRFWIASDAAASFTANSASLHVSTGDWVTSTSAIAAGTILGCVPLPQEGKPYERYLGIIQEAFTTALNAGAIDAYLTFCPPKHEAYPDGAPTPA